MNYTLKKVAEDNTERYLLCDGNKNFYAISKLLHDILVEYKISGSYKEVSKKINECKTENFFTDEFVEQSIKKALALVANNDSKETKGKTYIRHKFAIVKEGNSVALYRFLTLLFNKYLINILFLATIGVTLFFFFKNGYTNIQFLYSKTINSISIYNGILFYILFILIIIIHEIGHASAAFKFGIKPGEIGAGLYFIFPVLYTNITNIWALSSRKRITVNLGGIYFQLIINVILIILLDLNIFENFVFLLLVSNTSSILISFNPFFRYDGYWIFSDFFKIQNLRERSTAFMTTAILSPRKIKQYVIVKRLSSAIIVYSILNAVFWMCVYISLCNYFIQSIPKITIALNSDNFFTAEAAGIICTSILILIWLFTLLINTFIKFYNYEKRISLH